MRLFTTWRYHPCVVLALLNAIVLPLQFTREVYINQAMQPSRVTNFGSVASLVTKPKGMVVTTSGPDSTSKAPVIRKDPDAIHRTGSLRDLWLICQKPGNKAALKEFLSVSPHLCRRTISYGKSHSYGLGWYPTHPNGYVGLSPKLRKQASSPPFLYTN